MKTSAHKHCSEDDQDPGFTVLDPHAVVDGQSIAEWTADWWKSVLRSPADHNILTDTTGAFAHVRNHGHVFFIGGTLGGEAERTFSVRSGEPLLIPIVNVVDVEVPAAPNSPQSVEDTKAAIKANLDAFEQGIMAPGSSFTLTVDGQEVPLSSAYLERVDAFSPGTLRPHSVATDLFGNPAGVRNALAGSDGIWVMLDGLSKGRHDISFGASLPAFEFTTHVTDHIVVR